MPIYYLSMTWRRLIRHKGFSLINILGLSTGIASCLLIYGYVHHEMSYDDYHPLKDRIARVTSVIHTPDTTVPIAASPTPLASVLPREFPEIQMATRIQPGNVNVHQGVKTFKEEHFVYSEPSIFSLFSFTFLEGTASDALSAPGSLVVTHSTARKYFGDKEAIGQTLECNKQIFRVTAVIADRPSNSDIPIDALLRKDFKTAVWMADDFDVYTFVLFRGKPDLVAFDKKLPALCNRYIQPELDKMDAGQYHCSFHSEMLTEVHFSKGKAVDTPKGNKAFNTIFSLLAVFILLIALLNYINLSTAKATERAREVGVRKVAGARPFQLVRQFLGESFLLMGIAWLIAVGLTLMAMPFFNKLLSTHISLGGTGVVLFLVALFPLTVLLAGLYPAFVLSGFNPIRALKGGIIKGKGIGLRRLLSVVQFGIALAMLTGTVVIYMQMKYMMHRDLGMDRSQVVSLQLPRDDSSARSAIQTFTEALRSEPAVQDWSLGSGIPVEGIMLGGTTFQIEGKKKELLINYFFIDDRLLSLLHIPLAVGRNFSDSMTTDKQNFIVNEALVRMVKWKTPIGQRVEWVGLKGIVVGVVKDFFFKSLHNVIEPMAMVYTKMPPSAVLVKLAPGGLSRVQRLWEQYFPALPLDFYFMDEQFDAQYKKDRLTMGLFSGFTLLAIFISCLGLYGLVSLITLQRTREIGIRKVLGASLPGLLSLLSADIWKLLACAAVVALPLAGWGIHRWLSGYAYHVVLSPWMFLLPVALLAAIAGGFTGWGIVRAALQNPVKALRSE